METGANERMNERTCGSRLFEAGDGDGDDLVGLGMLSRAERQASVSLGGRSISFLIGEVRLKLDRQNSLAVLP